MTKRDVRLVELRPALGIDTEANSAVDSFQSNTLRPILSLQNALMVHLVSTYLRKYCPRFSRFSPTEKRSYVRDLLKRDSRPKHMLVGMVVGHFTEEEFTFYVSQEPEVRRRVIELCIQRIQEQIDLLCTDDTPLA